MTVYLGQISGAFIGGSAVGAMLAGNPAILGVSLIGVVIGLVAHSLPA